MATKKSTYAPLRALDEDERLALAPPVYRGWRYWRQQRIVRELREIYRSDYKTIRAEVTAQLQKRYTPADVKHFRALDRVRVKEIELLKARLERAEAQARELEEGNRFLRAQAAVIG